MDISIIIVSWNVRERLRTNLASLRLSRGAEFEMIVIDNASEDGSAEMVAREFPEVRLIRNAANLGFAKACNQGLRMATGRVSILLNPDMKLFPETLVNLKGWLDANPQADVIGIRLLDEAGQTLPQIRRFPRVWDQAAIVLKLPHIFPNILSSYLRADFDYSQAANVDSVRGAFFAIRRSALERFGYLDERYFIWFEEVDYCRTVARGGGEVWYAPVAQAVDYVGQSFNLVGRSAKQKYFRDSMLAYFKKWEKSWQAELLALAWDIAELLVAMAEALKVKPRAKT